MFTALILIFSLGIPFLVMAIGYARHRRSIGLPLFHSSLKARVARERENIEATIKNWRPGICVCLPAKLDATKGRIDLPHHEELLNRSRSHGFRSWLQTTQAEPSMLLALAISIVPLAYLIVLP